jgi:hypothetical protein
MMPIPTLSTVAILLALLVTTSHAWGKDGHSIIAAIAQSLLTPAALKGSLALLAHDTPPSPSLANVSSWADAMTHTPQFKWSGPLHFTNVQDSSPACITKTGYGNCTFVYKRDCVDREGNNPGFCNAGAIANYTTRLIKGLGSSKTSTATPTVQALKFLVHFVGDIHQPLHCGMLADRGGVKINVQFPVNDQGSKWNLHNVWDFGLIVNHEGLEGEWAPVAKDLQQQLKGWDTNAWQQLTDPKAWVQESLDQATRYAYRFANGTEIPRTTGYDDQIVLGDSLAPYMSHGGVIEVQLAKAGVRLATLLNGIWKQ